MKNRKFHIDFKLNGKSFDSASAIIDFSKEISFSMHQFLVMWFSDEDIITVHTSGSTGVPKLIQLKKEHMRNSAEMTGEFFNVKENTSALLCLSMDYIAGKMMLVRALVLGWQLDVVMPTSSPLVKIDKLYDFAAFVPLQLAHSLSKINQIKTLIVGGGKVSNTLIDKIQSLTTQVYATYGMTETITHIAVAKLNHYANKEGTALVYETLPGISISQDNRNCLLINAPALTTATVNTNDVVSLVSANQFMLLGRIDHVINSGGVKLHPEGIEDKLAPLIKTRFFVTGLPDNILGEKLVLVVEGDQEAINFKSVALSKFEVPKAVFFVPKFIETKTGKIQRSQTVQQLDI